MIGTRLIAASTLAVLSVCGVAAQTPTARIVTAANTFLATLDEKQRQNVLFAFNDEEQRKRWSNFPISIVPRASLSMKELAPAQRSAAMTLLSSTLSARGFEKVQQIMEGDEALKASEANGGGGGPPPAPGNGPQGGPGNGPRGGRGLGGGLLSAKICICSPFLEPLPRRNPGCSSSVVITLRSTSPLTASAEL